MKTTVTETPAAGHPARAPDFAWSGGRVLVRKTGVTIPVDRHLVAEVGHWLIWFAILGFASLAAALRPGRPLSIWFAPEIPRPWYLIRAAALWAGIRVARSPDQADAAVYFDDVTAGLVPIPPNDVPLINFACADVSKSHVAEVFQKVFGYPLALDPTTSEGPIVEKPEKNGVHAGRIAEAPVVPRPGHVYQRLVDTTSERGLARDLRTLIADGVPLLVWVKVKPAGRRFAIQNLRADLMAPGHVYTPAELARLTEFAARMGLDWGGMDVLRDRDGRIYVVDVNKTDVGPVIALTLRDKFRSMRLLAAALTGIVQAGKGETAADKIGAVRAA